MKIPGKLAAKIAKGYPVSAAFVQQCLDELNQDEARTRQWLDALAPTGRYFSPSVYGVINPEPPELELK